MSSIPGIEQLSSRLSAAQIEKLSKAAERHKTQSNITFTILSVSDDYLEIETAQGETKSGKYATEATLIGRTKELFEKLCPGAEIRVSPASFAPAPASIVNTAWLERRMQEKGVRIKQIAFDTGIDRESISDWVTGKRSMSQIVKAMFYFYLSR
ncbi:helix-turn-helix domain-containing protein [Pedobacter africanus]|uniref:Helix-turn-helix n=1 Tax=Pedobacter africanus TaxID=151894 RepID=A0A1W2CRS2_9SPHI|nr:helix-turn-helix transcriptional regulator [Pedobacter africanus]SMC87654.1 hypothetical protein SAMN04488524_3130 [Pedobacter africanus]